MCDRPIYDWDAILESRSKEVQTSLRYIETDTQFRINGRTYAVFCDCVGLRIDYDTVLESLKQFRIPRVGEERGPEPAPLSPDEMDTVTDALMARLTAARAVSAPIHAKDQASRELLWAREQALWELRHQVHEKERELDTLETKLAEKLKEEERTLASKEETAETARAQVVARIEKLTRLRGEFDSVQREFHSMPYESISLY